MKHTLRLLAIIVMAYSLNACTNIFRDNNCTEGSGDVITEDRTFDSSIRNIFNGIAGNVYIAQGNTQKVTIKAQANVIALLDLKVVNKELVIQFKNNTCINNANIDIFVTTPTIDKVTQAGSGNIIGQNIWNTSNLEIVLSGSGNIQAAIQSTDVQSTIIGSGSITLSGNTQNQRIEIGGSGNYNAFGLASEQAVTNITGSGSIEVLASKSLNATISGSGNIAYKSTPSVTQRISGSGKVINAN